MDEYLKYVRDSLKDLSSTKYLTIVIGNESCDLDSAVSSLVFAYFYHWLYASKQLENSSCESHIFIPLLNISKQDLPIKTEVVFSLKKYNISLDNIFFVENINFTSQIDNLKEKFNVILVDHHIMDEKFSNLIPHVSEIIDHRPMDSANWNYHENVKYVISNVGSCTTLVCAEILNHSNGRQFLLENTTAASLLYETIILDTINFSPTADKAKPLDFAMVKELEEMLKIVEWETERKNVFDSLLTARSNYSSLNSLQLLRKDMKIVNNIPIPGMPLLVENFLKREDVATSLETFCQQFNVKTTVIMGLAIVDGQVHRDLAVFTLGDDAKLYDKIVQSLTEAANPSLDLNQHPSNIPNCTYFKQNNTKASRKQIMPILKHLTID